MCDRNLECINIIFFTECNEAATETYSMLRDIDSNKMYYAHVFECHKIFLHNQGDEHDDSKSGRLKTTKQ
jgi:hypothetical protein